MTDSDFTQSNLLGDLPERLVKHTVRYADYRAVNRDDLTPMMRHYADIKDHYPHALLLYRVGDFFETFFQDAITIARELELVLTSKDAGKAIGRVPLAGIPHHALDRYCAQLVERGYAVAICDQTEEASEKQGQLVQREVTRVLTPGTILEEGMLNARRNNYLAAIAIAGSHWGLAIADVSTGEFLTTQSTELDSLNQELMRLQPSEVLVPTNAPDLGNLLRPGQSREGRSQLYSDFPESLPTQFCYTLRPQMPFTIQEARYRLLERFKVRSLEGFGCEHLPLAVRAAGGLLEYLEETWRGAVANPQIKKQTAQPAKILLQPLRTYGITEFLTIDYQTRRNLEITQTVRDGTYHGSLLWALDRTVTPMGGRLLRRWLLQPLLEVDEIEARQETIAELVNNGSLRQTLQQLLKRIYDLERLTGRAASGTANARDLVALADSLDRLPELASLLVKAKSPYLTALQQVPPALEKLGQHLKAHLLDEPPLYLTEGNLIRSGINARLDQLRTKIQTDEQWIVQLEVSERQRTGISNLKVGFSKTFGYFISITRAKSGEIVPDGYIRKQTLTNEERYITTELKDKENELINARTSANNLEYEIFVNLRSEVAADGDQIRATARAIAAADALCSFSEVAVYQGYCRPRVVASRQIEITEGRHPVVEQSLPAGFFVPNSAQLGHGVKEASVQGTAAPDLIILTGPNASGKSCYLRQIGLIQLMAQVGSFVPAKAAVLGVCDRIFTRVGAVDDLATGQSTFMVEMNETANILNHASDRSLVLLDEIGRGTATFDGLSIAWSVAEYLATELRSRTIFATHYHELNELESLFANIANYQVTVKEMPDQIIFLHQVRPGGADRSYGIEAGRLAGLPQSVIERAKQVMSQIEQHSKLAVGLGKDRRQSNGRSQQNEGNEGNQQSGVVQEKKKIVREKKKEVKESDSQLNMFGE
jgi:DNA mismatch repair protein MutS